MGRSKYEHYTKEQLLEKIKLLEKQRYGLVWEEKQESVAEQCDRELPVLKEDPLKEIISKDSFPQHILIEGDNYHALYTLNFTHKRKIDVIYIDPPYNTGKKDFKYNDHWVDNEDSYKHSKWLSFINKRLRLSKNLLKDSGVIFISIDDNELAQLKMLCDKVFMNNFLQLIVWKKRNGPPNDKPIGNVHEYILVYAKDKNKCLLNTKTRTEKQIKRYSNPDNHPKGPWTAGDLMANVKGGRYVESLYFGITNPITQEEHFPSSHGNWRFSKDTIDELIKNDEIYFGKNGKGRPKLKRFYQDVKEGVPFSSIWDTLPYNQRASREIEQILGNINLFDTPKPVDLIKEILLLSTKNDSVILDFFAGSGTTGQAVLEMNHEDNGSRQFILCTNNENNICEEITYPRIKNIIKGYSGIEGIPANLKYFRTDFVPQVLTDNDKRVLVGRSTELLCLTENTFELLKQSKRKREYAIFKNLIQITAIIYDEDAIERCKIELKELKPKEKIVIYVFSYDHEYNEEDFEDLPFSIIVKPIPEAILNVYRKNSKLRRK